jgi:hypothetical protein
MAVRSSEFGGADEERYWSSNYIQHSADILPGRRENGVFMKIVLIGANGTIGELVQKALAGAGHEIVEVGHKSGDFQVEIENRESVRALYQTVGSFDAVAVAAGQVTFAPLSELTAEKWQFSLGSKLMGSGGDPVHQRKRILHFGFGHSQ